jgi:hypothetical protein
MKQQKKRLSVLEGCVGLGRRLRDYLFGLAVPVNVWDHEDYVAARDALIQVKEGVSYEWACKFAKEHWERLDAIFKHLDEKADSIIKYFGGGTGLFALSTVFAINRNTVPIYASALPAFLLALVTVGLALWARNPIETALPPTVGTAKKTAEICKENGEAAFLKFWHEACVIMSLVIEKKGRRVQLATIAYFATLISLLLPISVAIGVALTIEPLKPGR